MNIAFLLQLGQQFNKTINVKMLKFNKV